MINMRFDYFYEEQSESYSFYRIPKILFTEDIFESLSTEAKVLYGLLLDRISLSREHRWIDPDGHVYVFYTVEDVKNAMRCGNTKGCRLFKELEDFGLIERKKQGLCRPAIIYVKNFTRFPNWEDRTSRNENSGVSQMGIPDNRNRESNNTDINKTEYIKTHSIHSEEENERMKTIEYFQKKLETEWLKEIYPNEAELVDEIFGIIIDTVCTKKETVYISGEYKPLNVVKSQLMKLDNSHIQFVMKCMKENTTQIRCMKQYLLTALYNAPLTINNYYQSLVNHDMAEGYKNGGNYDEEQ